MMLHDLNRLRLMTDERIRICGMTRKEAGATQMMKIGPKGVFNVRFCDYMNLISRLGIQPSSFIACWENGEGISNCTYLHLEGTYISKEKIAAYILAFLEESLDTKGIGRLANALDMEKDVLLKLLKRSGNGRDHNLRTIMDLLSRADLKLSDLLRFIER